MKPNERFTWALSVLDLRPQDTLLEIGCGAGLFIELIANVLDTGTIVAVDRSEAMIKTASKRNASSVSAGRAKFVNIDFLESNFKKNEFDKVIAFNVNFVWKACEREFEIIKKILKPTGRLYIFYQAPTWTSTEATRPVIDNLVRNSFEITDAIFKKMTPTPAFCIKAKPCA